MVNTMVKSRKTALITIRVMFDVGRCGKLQAVGTRKEEKKKV